MTEAIQMEVNSIKKNPFHVIEETGQVIGQMTVIAGSSPQLSLLQRKESEINPSESNRIVKGKSDDDV